MRRSGWGGDTPVTYGLLLAFLLVYIIGLFGGAQFVALLAWPDSLSWFGSLAFWQPLTFPLVHASPWHLLFDGLILFFFGGSLERAWGSARFALFFIVSGLIAGAVVMATVPFAGYPTARAEGVILIGMVGSYVACSVAFSTINPYATVLLLVFPIQARWLGIIAVGYEFLFRYAAYGGPVPALASIGVVTLFAWLFTTNRLNLAFWSGPSMKERIVRWQQRRQWRKWQREAARIQKPSDLFKR